MNNTHSNTKVNTLNQKQSGSTNNNNQDLPQHPQPHQPQTEAERQQQLQDARLEDQDARVKLPEHSGEAEPEHQGIGDTQQ